MGPQWPQHRRETQHPPSPEAYPRLSSKAQGKQKAREPERDTTLFWTRDSLAAAPALDQFGPPPTDTELRYLQAQGEELPFTFSASVPSPRASYESSRTVRPHTPAPTAPPKMPPPPTPKHKQSISDPTVFSLRPQTHVQISAPIQPRVTDIRAHLERDPTYSSPTYDLEIHVKLKFEPSHLK